MGDGDAAGLSMQEFIAYKCWAMVLYLRVCGVLYQLMGHDLPANLVRGSYGLYPGKR